MAAFIPYAMAAMAVAGQISSAYAAKNQAKAEENAARYNEQVAKNESQRALNESTANQLMLRRRQNQALGMQRAAAAQAGTGFGGSSGDVLDQSATLAELDALNVAYEGQVRSAGYMAEADLQGYYARAARSRRPTTFGTILAAGQAGASAFFGAKGFGNSSSGGASVLTGSGAPSMSLNSYTNLRYG